MVVRLMREPALRRLGTTIRNKWTLERLLGTGGMAAVYVGVHRIGRRDALKILHPQTASSKELCARFEREAEAANRFRHPGAVEIRDIDVTEDGAPFLVLELLEGETLSERERRLGRLTLPDVLRFADQLLDTLGTAHAQGIIHRDVKPANLYVIAGDRLKVLDFGLARILDDHRVRGELTRMGLVLGTTPYMPPEQAKGHDVDARADLFAVGATMFRLIAGRHVHEADTDFDLLMKMAKELAPPLARLAPGTPRDVCLLVDRALAYDRDQRYPDAAVMLEDVRAAARGAPPPFASRLAHGLDRDVATVPRPEVAREQAAAASVSISRSSAPSADTISVAWSNARPPSTDSITVDRSDAPAPQEESIRVEWSDEERKAPPAPPSEETQISPGKAKEPPPPRR
jgi:eukaryotic-like serine/threonine-protein kinase